MKVTTSVQGSELGTRVRRRSVYRAKAVYRADTSDMPIPYEAKGMFHNSRLVRQHVARFMPPQCSLRRTKRSQSILNPSSLRAKLRII